MFKVVYYLPSALVAALLYPGAAVAQTAPPLTAAPMAPSAGAAPTPPSGAAPTTTDSSEDLSIDAAPANAPSPAPASTSPVPSAPPVPSSARSPAANAVPAPSPVQPSAAPAAIARAEPKAAEKNSLSQPVPTGLRIGGYLQAQFESNQLSVDQLDQSGAPLNQNRFSVRRARVRFDRGWDYASGTLELDASTTRGVNVGIRRAEASLLYRGKNAEDSPPLVMLTAGVTDLPFGFEVPESSRVRPFMERSLGSLALFPSEMDVGAKLSGAVSFVRYAFALSNGEPVDTLPGRFPRDSNSHKDVSGRVGVETRPLPALAISGGSSFYEGKGFHPGSAANKASFNWLDVNENRVIDPGELQAVPATAATPSANFERWAYALDVELSLLTKYGTTRLVAEGFLASNMDRGYLVADPGLSGNDVREAGGYVALTQDVTRFGQVGFRASFYDPNADLFQSLRGRQVPTSLAVRTLSPLVALRLPERARLSLQYDFVHDYLAKDARGVPTDAKNNQFTLRLQVEL